jgi:hypothetical protein
MATKSGPPDRLRRRVLWKMPYGLYDSAWLNLWRRLTDGDERAS